MQLLAEQGGIYAVANCCLRAVAQGIKIVVMQKNSAQLGTCKYLRLGAKPSHSLST